MIEVLRELLRETRDRVNKTVYTAPPTCKVTSDARAFGRAIRSHWHDIKRVEKRLARMGFDVRCPYSGGGNVGRVTAAAKANREHRAAFDMQQAGRLTRITQLRQSALIDTLGMNRQALVAYMRNVQMKLAAV